MTKTFLILEIEDKLIKICHVNPSRNKTVISNLEVVEFPQKVIDKDLDDLFARLSKSEYEKVLISFPRTFFLIRFLDLPSQNREEIVKMLPFQLAKVVPYPLDVVTYDFSVLEVKDGVSKVVVFLIQEKKVSHFLEVINKSKITPGVVTISSWGLYNWFNFQKKYREEKIDWPVVLVDIDKYSSELLAASDNNIIFSRSFYYLNDEELLEGVNQSLDIFEKTFGKRQFGKVIFTGNKKDNVISKFNSEKVSFMNYWEKFLIDNKVREYLTKNNFSFASILGLSAVKDLSKFDFSPLLLKEKREFSKIKQKYWKVFLLSLEVMFILGVVIFRIAFDKYAYLKFINSKLKEIKPKAEEFNKFKKRLKVIEELSQEPYFSDIVEGVISSLPQGTKVTLLDFQGNGHFSMKGYAQDYPVVYQIKSALNKRDFFKEVKVNYVSVTKQQNMEMVEFHIYGERKLSTNEK